MKQIVIATFLAATLAVAAYGQADDIRNPNIDTQTDDGKLAVEAGMAEDVQERIKTLNELLANFPESPYRGYALFQLQRAHIEAEDMDNAIKVTNDLLEIAPGDVEILHNINQALVTAQRWDDLRPFLAKTAPAAAEEAARPKPSNEDEAAAWEGQTEYAAGVGQYAEWAMNTAASQQTDPAKRIEWLDQLREHYPDGTYAQDIEGKYARAYQEMGDSAKMVEWMEKAIEAGAEDESYYYSIAEHAFSEKDYEKAQSYAEKALEILEAKPQPEGMSEEDWENRKKRLSAYSHFVLGRIWVGKNTAPAYRTGRSHLLQTVDVLKAEGGPRYGILAYLLGVCYVQLDIAGDNIRQATHWMTEAANAEGPYKAQAQEALAKIKAAR